MDEDAPAARVTWIDKGADDKELLRTNKSEDDLVCLENIEPVQSHKATSCTAPGILRIRSRDRPQSSPVNRSVPLLEPPLDAPVD